MAGRWDGHHWRSMRGRRMDRRRPVWIGVRRSRWLFVQVSGGIMKQDKGWAHVKAVRIECRINARRTQQTALWLFSHIPPKA
jgi:hypothetical protein